MSRNQTKEVTITWEASSGRKYEIPVEVDMVFDADYGSDADGNRGISGWEFEDFRLANGMLESQIGQIITNEEDEEEFYLDALSEDAFEKALDLITS